MLDFEIRSSESSADYNYEGSGSAEKVMNNSIINYPNQIVIPAVWAGGFVVSNRQYMRSMLQGLYACLSSKASRAALAAVEQLPPSIQWEKVPKGYLHEMGLMELDRRPTADDIAVFFFPALTTKHDTGYSSLLSDLIRQDSAMIMRKPPPPPLIGDGDAELLLFTSIELPPLFRTFHGKPYLWELSGNLSLCN